MSDAGSHPPPERQETVRAALERVLREGPATSRDLSTAVGIPEKDIAEHLEHVRRSLGADAALRIEPAACLACGFIFQSRARFTRPSRCPTCKSERIDPPAFSISEP